MNLIILFWPVERHSRGALRVCRFSPNLAREQCKCLYLETVELAFASQMLLGKHLAAPVHTVCSTALAWLASRLPPSRLFALLVAFVHECLDRADTCLQKNMTGVCLHQTLVAAQRADARSTTAGRRQPAGSVRRYYQTGAATWENGHRASRSRRAPPCAWSLQARGASSSSAMSTTQTSRRLKASCAVSLRSQMTTSLTSPSSARFLIPVRSPSPLLSAWCFRICRLCARTWSTACNSQPM